MHKQMLMENSSRKLSVPKARVIHRFYDIQFVVVRSSIPARANNRDSTCDFLNLNTVILCLVATAYQILSSRSLGKES